MRHEPENWLYGTFLTETRDWNEQLKYKSDTINVEKKRLIPGRYSCFKQGGKKMFIIFEKLKGSYGTAGCSVDHHGLKF